MASHPTRDRTYPPTRHGAMTRYVFRRHVQETHAGRAGPRFEIKAIVPHEDEPHQDEPRGYTLWRRVRER